MMMSTVLSSWGNRCPDDLDAEVRGSSSEVEEEEEEAVAMAQWRRRLGWQQWCGNGNTTINLKNSSKAASNSVYKGGSGGGDQGKMAA